MSGTETEAGDADPPGSVDLAEAIAELRAELRAVREQLEAAATGTATLAAGLADALRAGISELLIEGLREADAARQTGMEHLAKQLNEADAIRQTGIDELSRQLRQQLQRADEQRSAFTEQVTHQLSQADVARHEGMERLLVELAAVRGATDRRASPRRRRVGGEAERVAAPATSADVERRFEQALCDLDRRVSELGEHVHRAVAFADDAAQASIATFRALTAVPPAPDDATDDSSSA